MNNKLCVCVGFENFVFKFGHQTDGLTYILQYGVAAIPTIDRYIYGGVYRWSIHLLTK